MLVVGEDMAGHAFLARHIEHYAHNPADPVICAVRAGVIVGACAYHDLRTVGPVSLSIELSCAGVGNWLTRGNLAGFLWYPFEQLGVRRLVGSAHVDNPASWGFMERLGFKHEGVLRSAGVDGGDVKIYSLLADEAAQHLRHQAKTKWSRRDGKIIAKNARAA